MVLIRLYDSTFRGYALSKLEYDNKSCGRLCKKFVLGTSKVLSQHWV